LIAGQPHGLILIYPQGNYITSSDQTPYLQIGESKYGKPALDRIAQPGLSLNEGARLCLVSLDATARSNITVGPPFEVSTYAKDSLKLNCRCSFDEKDEYLVELREAWNTGINNVFLTLPVFEDPDKQPVQQPIELPMAQQSEQTTHHPTGQFKKRGEPL
jgi:putative proteasome-type protease